MRTIDLEHNDEAGFCTIRGTYSSRAGLKSGPTESLSHTIPDLFPLSAAFFITLRVTPSNMTDKSRRQAKTQPQAGSFVKKEEDVKHEVPDVKSEPTDTLANITKTMHNVIATEIGKAVSNLLTPDRIDAIVGATLASLGHASSNAATVENRRSVMTRTVVDLTADNERSKEMVDLTADSDYEPTTSSRRRNAPVTPKSETVNDRTDYEPTASSRRRISPVAPKSKTRQPSIAEFFGRQDSDSGSLFVTSDTSDDESSDLSTAPAFERPGTTENAVAVRRNRTITEPGVHSPAEQPARLRDTTAVLQVQNDPNSQGDGVLQKKKAATSTLKFAPSIRGWQTPLDYSRRNRNDKVQRLPCLWSAFFNEKFRRRVLLYAWRNLARIRPGIRPWWHLGVTATPFDTNTTFRDGTLLGGCRYHQPQGPKGVSDHQQKSRNIHFACDHLDNDGNRCTSMSIRLQFTWILALAFNRVTPQMW